ncbi:unnamed protein product [Schistocephalus solidus]|uniref:Reverse transcriptase domain-containing protein n=1 Tax=Schistocephalus solidus TaxID=70667 RepID=A0A183SRU9_SCHSO|nr:unnamed protein product [Schistocephalus solidus]
MTDRDIQRSMNLFAAAFDNLELRISTEKTAVMHQPPPNTTYNAARITANDIRGYLNQPEQHLLPQQKIEDEVAHRIAKARLLNGSTQNVVWNRHVLHLSTQIKMHKKQSRKFNHYHLIYFLKYL